MRRTDQQHVCSRGTGMPNRARLIDSTLCLSKVANRPQRFGGELLLVGEDGGASIGV